MSTAKTTKAVVQQLFGHLQEGDMQGAQELMTEDATWRVSGHPESIPLAGTYCKHELPGLMAMVGKAMPNGIRMAVTGITADDTRATVEAEVHGVSPAGKVYDNRNCFVVDVQDGQVSAIREYYDTIHTNEVLFGIAYPDGTLPHEHH
ncbi:nuclear transport factor 2 family protein [Streptomyces sp. NPDC090075]|uniref:nuclear transport factor 2 family protein n=1 Tax=Streptomyces sp. NPDC090075 TaxID=3365937 RepID=UPI0038131E34